MDISNEEKFLDILLSTFVSGVVYVFLNFSLLLALLFDGYTGEYLGKYLYKHFEDLSRYLYNPLIRAFFVIIPVVVYYLLLKYVRLNRRISYRLSHKLHKKTEEEITANTPSFTFWCDVFLLGLLLGTIIFTFLIFRFFFNNIYGIESDFFQ